MLRSRASRLSAALVAATTALSLAACGDDSEADDSAQGSSGGSSSSAFPVTIEHAYGETTIESKPERVATVAWANHEVPLALGVVPVGMAAVSWGDDDDDGVLPWVEDKLEELGADTPALFDETEGIDFEAVADTQPDVILASYSGLTEEEYDTLSKIAPTIAFPDLAWGTSMDDMIEMNATALGLKDEGEALEADLDGQIADAVAEHPELDGLSGMFAFIDPTDLSQVGYYTTHDTRPAFLELLGMTTPPVIADASAGSDEFYLSTSAEKADEFADVDVMVTYGDPEGEQLAAVQADPLLSQIPAIARGSVVVLPDSTPLAASANPSPLSIPWGLDEYVDLIAAAAAKVG
jgi:iron complex transport system substrate-binding protein